MPQTTKLWGGEEWQRRVCLWLSIRHKEEWVPVPDSHGGDFGIEGFTRAGSAYQCYAAEGLLDVAGLYAKQRDKMTEDIKKFCDNINDLKKVFGTTKIKKWILVVPKHQSAKLNQHATQKASEVLAKNLPYVDGEFQIHIYTDDDFVIEESTALCNGAGQLVLDLPDVKPEEVDIFKQLPKNNPLMRNLSDKVPKIAQKLREQQKVTDTIVLSFIRGRNLLDHLRKYPEFWERIDKIKRNRERLLELPNLVATASPAEVFTNALKEFSKELREGVPVLSPSQADALAQEAVSDWLLRCPLQFPD